MTVVEWLFEQINNTIIDYTEGRISASIYGVRLTEYEYKAKEMEKQQAFEFWQGGMKCTEQGGKSFDQYYHENFTNDTKI